MKFYSPLRYPGGKIKLANFLGRVCEKNLITGHYIEPYAGGAAVALSLLLEEKVSKITINDKDRSIYAFWYSVLYYTEELCHLINTTTVNLSEWQKQKDVQKRKDSALLLELGFSTFFLNRTNRSGIIDAGPIGGFGQKGNYKLDCRFNREELIARIKKIGEYKKRINLYNLDALKLIEKIKTHPNEMQQIFYFDPPYYLKGESLYLNSYLPGDHKKVAKAIQSIKNAHWIVTYDNTLPIKKLYSLYRSKQYTLPHMAFKPRVGKEIMFLSNNLSIPKRIFA